MGKKYHHTAIFPYYEQTLQGLIPGKYTLLFSYHDFTPQGMDGYYINVRFE